ncbi:MAG: efflux RND transporter periplasmic adaptor subunit [Rubrivivax sp.]
MQKTTTRRWIAGGLALLLLGGAGAALVAAGVLPGGGGDDKKKVEPTLAFAAREVAQPTRQPMPDRVEFSGPLVAPSTAIVRAKAAGTLLALTVREGDRVRAGQPLGRIDQAEASSRVAERDAMVVSAEATLAQAERQHTSNERLADQRFISANALQTSRATVDTARAQVDAARASRQVARVGLRDGTLLAPIDGIVTHRQVVPGEKVSPEQAVLTIIDLRRLELAGSVPTHLVGRLSVGLAVALEVEGLTTPLAGRIGRIAPAAQPGTRSIGVTIALDNAAERMRAGQYAQARVELADDTPRLTLPASALVQASGQDHVWVVENGVLARRAITVGRRDERGGRVEVLAGVAPGATVLAARFENLREGAKATVATTDSGGALPPVASSAASAPVLVK